MKLTVHASKKYDIVSCDGFEKLGEEVKKVFRGEKILIVTDSNVAPLYLKKVKEALVGYELIEEILLAGEASKNVENYLRIISVLAENSFARTDGVLALGGGVIGDMAGFAAATYMRGVTFIQCPTSFLAMIDSSVGGKTAVDLPQGKNLLGAFYQPSLVYIALSVIKTLPEREVKCGMGEAVKYAFLSDTVTAKTLEKGITEELIFRCLAIKAEVVEGDEFDKGRRAILNLGHTIGHAVEKMSDYSLSHGECVAKGIAQIIKMSEKFYGYGQEKSERMNKLLSLSGVDLTLGFPIKEVLKQTAHDKKKESSGVKYVLIKEIGQAESVLLTEKQAEALII